MHSNLWLIPLFDPSASFAFGCTRAARIIPAIKRAIIAPDNKVQIIFFSLGACRHLVRHAGSTYPR